MKKLLVALVFAGLTGTGLANVSNDNPCKHNCDKNKITHNKAVRKTGKGTKHGVYDLSHNKATKGLHINKGNRKYKHQDDI